MTQRVVLTYQKEDGTEKTRLFLRNGITMNPQAEETVRGNSDFTAVAIRRTGEKKRSLIFVEEAVTD